MRIVSLLVTTSILDPIFHSVRVYILMDMFQVDWSWSPALERHGSSRASTKWGISSSCGQSIWQVCKATRIPCLRSQQMGFLLSQNFPGSIAILIIMQASILSWRSFIIQVFECSVFEGACLTTYLTRILRDLIVNIKHCFSHLIGKTCSAFLNPLLV